MNVVARPAEQGDTERLAVLASLARDEVSAARGGGLMLGAELQSLDGPRPGTSREDGAKALSGVVLIDDLVVGYVEAIPLPLKGERLCCRIQAIYVQPEAREVGAGEALMELVSNFAADIGADGIDALVLPGARETKNFFEAAGFAARLIVMHHRLGE